MNTIYTAISAGLAQCADRDTAFSYVAEITDDQMERWIESGIDPVALNGAPRPDGINPEHWFLCWDATGYLRYECALGEIPTRYFEWVDNEDEGTGE